MDAVKKGALWTAQTLPANMIDDIRYHFENILGVKVMLDVFSDTTLLGGFIAHIDGKVYDASLRTRLESIREHMAAQA